MNILDPQGPIAAADKTILIDSIAIMLAIVVPTIVAIFAVRLLVSAVQSARTPSARLGLFRPHRTRGLVDPGAHRHPARRRRLDRRAPARSCGAGRGHRRARSESRSVSLDWKWLFIYPDQRVATVNSLTVPVGVPLHFELTSASVMNVVLHPAARQHDLHDERHDHAAQPARGPGGQLPGPFGAFQRRRFSRHDFDVHVVPPLDFPDLGRSPPRKAAPR